MKYFSINSVINAYNHNTKTTTSKFWGILGILYSIQSEIIPGLTYPFSTGKTAQFLEDLFCFGDKKNYSNLRTKYYVMFSNVWVEKIRDIMCNGQPNFFYVACWYLRNYSFHDEFVNNPDSNFIIKVFSEQTGLQRTQLELLFGDLTNMPDFSFSSIKPSEEEILEKLSEKFGNDKGYVSITSEGSFIKANPGEFARAPFIQTIYASQQSTECLFLTQFPIPEYYSNPNKLVIERKEKNLPLQQIYYGAPGTGKSFTIDEETNDENSVRTTFHPDSDYASFVGAYKPTMEDVPISAIVGKEVHAAVPQGNHTGKEKKIVYKYVPQAFLKAYVAAWSDLSTPQYLVIEEINRGNCAQIFGDLFQLLDRNNSGASSYPIHADEDIKQFLKDDKKGFAGLSDERRQAIADYILVKDNGDERHIGQQILDGELLLLPPNLHIWATMNTSDQSLFPIDSAFKRRWDWKYIPISYNPTDKKTGQGIKWKFNVGENLYSWGEFLSKINPEIYTLTESSDKQMGYFFAKANPSSGIISEEVFLNKVLFYLWTEVLKDYTTGQEIFINPDTKKTFVFTDFFDEKQNALANFIGNLKLEEVEDYEPAEGSENSKGSMFIVDGTKTRSITTALCLILSEVAKFKTYTEILEEVTSNIKRSEPIIKKVENPSEYKKENGWKNMILKTADDVSFVVTNQWKKEMVPMILDLADKFGVEVEYTTDSDANPPQKDSGLSPTKKWYEELLTELRSRYSDSGYNFQSVTNNYIGMATGVPGMGLINRVNKRGSSRVELWIQPSRASEIFNILSRHKDEIENQFGSSLTWIESAESDGGNKHAEISFIKDGINFDNPEEYKAAVDWLLENGIKLYEAVKPYFPELK